MTHSEMRRRQEDKEDDPRTASECQHAQSKLTCIAGRRIVNLLLMYIGVTIFSCTYYIYCSRKINHLVSEPLVFIL